MKKAFCISILVVSILGGWIVNALVTRVPESARISAELQLLEREIRAYCANNGFLPRRLHDVLNAREDGARKYFVCDEAMGQIDYLIKSNTVVELRYRRNSRLTGKVKQTFSLEFEVR